MKFKAVRNIPLTEQCSGRIIKKGELLYPCNKPTYGCISSDGIALTFNKDGDYPFFEVKPSKQNLKQIK